MSVRIKIHVTTTTDLYGLTGSKSNPENVTYTSIHIISINKFAVACS